MQDIRCGGVLPLSRDAVGVFVAPAYWAKIVIRVIQAYVTLSSYASSIVLTSSLVINQNICVIILLIKTFTIIYMAFFWFVQFQVYPEVAFEDVKRNNTAKIFLC